MKPLLKLSLAVIVILASFKIHGQHESTLHFMTSLPQVSYNNPAFQPRYKFSIGLPGSSVYFQAASNGFRYNDFATVGDDYTDVSLSKLTRASAKRNYFTTAAQADLFRFSMKASARTYLTANVTAKTYQRQMIPKEMLDIFSDGSALANQSSTLSPQVESLGYVEMAAGASHAVNNKLTVGARVKLLKGMMNATTEKSRFDISVNEGYITASADVLLKTSGINQFDDDDFDIGDDWKTYKQNNGFAFDLGSTYAVNDKLTLGLSLIDIGSIMWKNDPYAYRLDSRENSVTFKAVDLEAWINGDESSFNEASDSLELHFDFEKGAIAKYRTPLPGKIYLSGSYALKKCLTAGVLLFAEKFRGRFSPGISASINKEFGRRLSTSLSYTITNNSFNNIGAGLSLNFAPLQFYIVGDNLLRAPLSLLRHGEIEPYLYGSQFVNVRAGLNFVFGWYKTQEKLSGPKS